MTGMQFLFLCIIGCPILDAINKHMGWTKPKPKRDWIGLGIKLGRKFMK